MLAVKAFGCRISALILSGGIGTTVGADFVFPLDVPAGIPPVSVALPLDESEPGWTPLAFVFSRSPSVGSSNEGGTESVVWLEGSRWISRGVEAGALVLTTGSQRLLIPSRPEIEFGASGDSGPRPFTVSAWVWMEDATHFTIAEKGDGQEWLFGFDREDRLLFSMGRDDRIRIWRTQEPLTNDERAWRHYAAVVHSTGPDPRVELFRGGEALPVRYEPGTNRFEGLRATGAPLAVGSGSNLRLRTRGALGGFRLVEGVVSPERIRAEVEKGTNALEEDRFATIAPEVTFPGQCDVELWSWRPWADYDALRFEVELPADAPTNVEALVYVKDWNHYWYQTLVPGYLAAGTGTPAVVSLAPEAESWVSVGHHMGWHYRVLLRPRTVGLRIFCKEGEWTGQVAIVRPSARLRFPIASPPVIRDVRPAQIRVPCYEKFEVSFRISDRYLDPFDSNQVHVTARFLAPGGSETTVEGFYDQSFFREVTPAGERIIPQGKPIWRVRYAPWEPGVYRYVLRVRDPAGETEWGPGRFTAEPSVLPGFIRVSPRDPRHFEFSTGEFFYPIGHNIRSTFDTRHDGAFPWRQRFEEGTSAFGRYFRALGGQGGNLVEIWMAPWSLGLEWNEAWSGYGGIGQYNLRNAWEMDEVLAEAARNHLYVNLVIHNHGKYSLFSDNEFVWNPFNVDNGGYLKSPNDFFTHPQAIEDFRKLMRYIIARWGYSRWIFAWQLWSEVDLVGEAHGFYRRPEVVEWHRQMGHEVKGLDPNDHLVSTHVCGDYTHQNPAIIGLPEMDLAPVDAYHGSRDPLEIVRLMKATAQFNNPFKKPVLITEFGGAWNAADRRHLEATFHAGLWSSVGIPLGGAPLFWWWMLIEERNLYPTFGALARFMKGEDRRDPTLVQMDPIFLREGKPVASLIWSCMANSTRALGWVAIGADFQNRDPVTFSHEEGIVMTLERMDNGRYVVEIWNTVAGRAQERLEVEARERRLTVLLPPFSRDFAFKVRRVSD